MRLSKLHGLANDFLVLLHAEDEPAVGPEVARALCHRRTGVGADGLLQSRPDPLVPGGITFHLLNADGSEAEMSGNGIRCLALAAVRAGWWDPAATPVLPVATPAGPRPLRWVAGSGTTARMTVEMGSVQVLGETPEGWVAEIGNPHLVKLLAGGVEDLAAVSLEGVPLDRNVEWVVRGAAADELHMRVHERGAGETQACGTGSTALAAVAHRAGWVGNVVTVHNPGGSVVVDLRGERATLTGPAVHVADLEVPDPDPSDLSNDPPT